MPIIAKTMAQQYSTVILFTPELRRRLFKSYVTYLGHLSVKMTVTDYYFITNQKISTALRRTIARSPASAYKQNITCQDIELQHNWT